MTPVRVLITGSRSWSPYDLADRIVTRLLTRYGPGLVLVHGDATGVDRAFREAAEEIGVEQEAHPADWSGLGRRAGPNRNEAMVAAGAVLCLAVHRDLKASKGTKDCVSRALKAGIPVWLIDSEDGKPRRIREV